MNPRLLSFAAILLVAIFAITVRNQTPVDHAWVPADGFQLSLDVDMPETATVGEWIVIDATRTSGPWKLVPNSEIPPYVIAFPTQPPERESGVAASLGNIAYAR